MAIERGTPNQGINKSENDRKLMNGKKGRSKFSWSFANWTCESLYKTHKHE
jgi:hypothetical protein